MSGWCVVRGRIMNPVCYGRLRAGGRVHQVQPAGPNRNRRERELEIHGSAGGWFPTMALLAIQAVDQVWISGENCKSSACWMSPPEFTVNAVEADPVDTRFYSPRHPLYCWPRPSCWMRDRYRQAAVDVRGPF